MSVDLNDHRKGKLHSGRGRQLQVWSLALLGLLGLLFFAHCDCASILILPRTCRSLQDCGSGRICRAGKCVGSAKEGAQQDAGAALPDVIGDITAAPEIYDGDLPESGCPPENPSACLCQQKSVLPYAHIPGTTRMKIAPDGKSMVTLDSLGWLMHWDRPQAQIQAALQLKRTRTDKRTIPMAWHSASNLVAVATADTSLQFYLFQNTPQGAQWQVQGSLSVPQTAKRITRLRFSPDGRFLAIATESHRIYFRRCATPPKGGLVTCQRDTLSYAHRATITAMAFSPDSSKFFSAGLDQRLNQSMLSVVDGKLVREPGLTYQISQRLDSLAISPKGQRIAFSIAGTTWLYEGVPLTTKSKRLGNFKATANAMTFTPDGRRLATLDGRRITLWQLDLDEKGALKATQQFSYFGAFALDAVGSVGPGPTIRAPEQLFVTDRGGTIFRWPLTDTGTPRRFVYSAPGTDYALHPTRDIAAVGRLNDGTITIWSRTTGRPLLRWQAHQAVYLTGLAFAPRGDILVSADRKEMRFWRLRFESSQKVSYEELSLDPPVRPRFPFNHLRFARNGSLLAFVAEDDSIQIWRLREPAAQTTLRVWQKISAHKSGITTLAVSPKGRWLASADDNRNLYLFRLRDDNRAFLVARLKLPAAATALAFTPDEARLLVSARDRSIQLWDIRDRGKDVSLKQNFALRSPTSAPIVSLAFHPRGDAFVAATRSPDSPRSRLYIWELRSKRVRQVLEGGFTSINEIFFRADNSLLYFSPGNLRTWTCP